MKQAQYFENKSSKCASLEEARVAKGNSPILSYIYMTIANADVNCL